MNNPNLLEETIQDFYDNCDVSGQSEYAVPRLLYALILAQRPKTVVEIGAHMGLSSMAMAAALKFNAEYKPSDFLKQWKSEWHPTRKLPQVKGKLYCIDPVLQPHWVRRLKKFKLQDYAEHITKRSEEVDLATLPNIDLLFIDGDHLYKSCHDDFVKYFPKVNPGGYVVIHDYFPDSPTPQMPWWGPNLFIKQVREALGFTDVLIVDTHFQGLAILRKKVDYIDYPFLDTNYVKGFIQFILRSSIRNLRALGRKIMRSVSSHRKRAEDK
jgi:predicted O-methyltransferase YrrM